MAITEAPTDTVPDKRRAPSGGAFLSMLRSRKGYRSSFSLLSGALSLQACGGDDDDPTPELEEMITLTGGDDNDTLDGGSLSDTLMGGGGNDTLTGLGGADTLDGGNGSDFAAYDSSEEGVTVDLSAAADSESYVTASGGDAEGDRLKNIENLRGSGLNDQLTGDANENILLGQAGNDQLQGGGGDDLLVGEIGADTLDGGAGSDTVDYSASTGAVTVDLSTEVNDYSQASGGDAEGDRLKGIENLIGSSQNDVLVGNGDINKIIGGDGGDTLTGNAGADELTGGNGNDFFIYLLASDSASDAPDQILDFILEQDVIDLSGLDADSQSAGIQEFSLIFADFSAPGQLRQGLDDDQTVTIEANMDTNFTTVDFMIRLVNFNGTLTSADFEGVVDSEALPTSDSIIPMTGDNGDNRIVGTVKADILIGLGGNDTLIGGGDADILYGGTGMDTADYEESLNGVTINLGGPRDTEGYVLGTGGDAEGDRLIGIETLIGSDQSADTLIGDRLANRLEGLGGDDALTGGGGDDIFAYSQGDRVSLGRDQITDFTRGQDKLDLSGLDGNTTTNGMQPFNYVGNQSGFSAAGQIRYSLEEGSVVIEVNTDADHNDSELTITLIDVDTLSIEDFILGS